MPGRVSLNQHGFALGALRPFSLERSPKLTLAFSSPPRLHPQSTIHAPIDSGTPSRESTRSELFDSATNMAAAVNAGPELEEITTEVTAAPFNV